MDESTRRLERAVLGGEPAAAARHARQLLRAGRPEEALQRLGALGGSEAAAVRAGALLATGRVEPAADAAGEALAGAPGAVEADLLDRIGRALLATRPEAPLDRLIQLRRVAGLGGPGAALLRGHLSHPDPLARAQLARNPALAAACAQDTSPLVRYVAAGAPPLPPFPREAIPTRLFSAWGRDWDLGRFVAVRASLEAHLRAFDWALLEAIDGLLGPGERVVAMGLGYGLAVPSGAPTGDLEERVAAVNAAGVLPFPLEASSAQPFDRLDGIELDGTSELSPGDERLARRFAFDLSRHPARVPVRAGAPDSPYLYTRLLRCFAPAAPAPREDELEPLRTAAREAYGPVGLRALALFEAKARHEMAAREARHRPELE